MFEKSVLVSELEILQKAIHEQNENNSTLSFHSVVELAPNLSNKTPSMITMIVKNQNKTRFDILKSMIQSMPSEYSCDEDRFQADMKVGALWAEKLIVPKLNKSE
jgi:hypothetical protein